MSEKRVNIRITASTSDFDKAIKKAQQQIEKLADTIDDMSKGKFGDNLEKQLDSVTDAAKKMQKQLEEMQESLDDMNKSKVDKLEKKLDDVSDSAEDLNEELEDTTNTLEDMNKAKVDKLKKQFEDTKKITETFDKKLEDVIDSLKDIDGVDIDNVKKSFEEIKDANQGLERRIGELLESFDELDSQDLNRLQNELEQIQTDFRELGDGIKDSFGDLDRQLQDAANEMDYFGRSIEDIDYDNLDKLEENVRDLDKYIDESTQSMQDFNKELTDLDTTEYDNLAKVMEDLGDSRSKFSFSSDNDTKNKSNKDKSFASDMATELLGANVAANRITDSIDELSDHLNDVVDSMRDMNDLTAQEQVKSYNDLVETMMKLQDEMIEYGENISFIEGKQESLTRQQKEFTDLLDDARKMEETGVESLKELADAIGLQEKALEDYEKALMDAAKAVDFFENKAKDITKADKRQDDIDDELQAIEDNIDKNLLGKLEKLTNYFTIVKDEGKEAFESLRRIFDYDGLSANDWMKQFEEALDEFDTVASKGNNRVFLKVRNTVVDIYEELDKVVKLWKEFDDLDIEKNRLELELQGWDEAKEKLESLQSKDVLDTYEKGRERLNDLIKEYKELEKALNDLRSETADSEDSIKFFEDQIEKTTEKLSEYEDAMKKAQDAMEKGNKVTNDQADEINKQLKAYEKLSKRVREYLEDEEKSIFLREKVAKSFKEVSDAMEKVYSGSSKHNNADLVNKTLEEAAKHVKELNVVNTKNLQNDLDRLGKIIEDKTDKIKRFKALNEEFGSKDSGLAYWLEQESRALRDYANRVPVVVEAMDTLRKAWGDVSIGGEDNLKLRARAELLDDFADNLKKNIAKIKNAYSELESLDDIYEKATDEQKLIIDDYKAWEKNEEALKEYNRAINEYLKTIRDSGGQIDSKFLNELGKFDPQKFIDNFERMGTSSEVLQKQFNACKIELEEWLKTEKEARQEAVKNAEAALEQAKAQEKAAKSQEEIREATERTTKAQEELVEAKKRLKDFTSDASKEIKQLNEIAEGFRKIGMAAKDLDKSDIAKFDKSLASMLDRLKTFDNDIPKTFGDLKEDISAVFADMDSLDLGGVWDGLKDIGAGLFSKIPTELKVALGAATAIGVALKESAEMGIEHFGKGADTIKNALSGIVDIARDIGQEIVSAFENITGMDMDFSSLIETPIDFESQIAKVGAIAGVDRLSEKFKELEALARELGATTRYSATEVAQAMEYMAMAGWEFEDMTKESKDGVSALESVLSLATVAQMDLGQASDFVTDGLTALGEEADQAARFVNILAAASTSSNTSVAQMQRAFTNCAPVAGTLGVSMEDLSIALGLMADKGVKGAKAGTALKNLMANLSAPTQKQLDFIKEFNLEGAQQAIVEGRLIDGLKQMQQALSNLSPKQKNAIISTIAGKEALSGISALLNTTEGDMAKLEAAIRDCDGAAKAMAEDFDKTVKGSLLKLASAMQERLLQVFDKTKDGIMKVTDQLAEFFNIWNGMPQLDETQGLTGLADAFSYLEGISEGWGEAIAQNLEKAIGAIDDFVNGGNLDKVLQIGTNIIDGICDGIQAAADNGTLDSAISGAIKRIATWFSENLDTIVEVGGEIIDAISKGISENGDEIGEVIKSVMEMQTEIDKAIAYNKWKLIGENLMTFVIEGVGSKVSVFISSVAGFLCGGLDEALTTMATHIATSGSTMIGDPLMAFGKWMGEMIWEGLFSILDGTKLGDWISGMKEKLNPANWFGGDSKKSSTGKTPDTSSITGKSPIDLINSELSSGKVKTDTTAAEIGQGISDNITKKLETMDAAALKELNTELQNLNTTTQSVASGMGTSFAAIQEAARTSFMGFTNIVRNQLINCTNIMRNQMVNCANIVRNQCVNMANIFRNQFVSMSNVARNQMVNVSNIIRNQSVNWSNIIRNQVVNGRNAFTQQMMSMAAVARTQMVNVSNIIRNQAINWYNIINNQAKRARDAFTSQMISMAKVASTQMSKVSASIRGAMSQASSKSMSLNVSTNYSGLSANALYAANNASTMSLGNNMSALASNASYAMSTGGGSSAGSSIGSNITLEIPVLLDGRELARSSARYVDNELKLMTKRENRKRGAK